MGHDLTTTHARLSPIPLHADRGISLARGEGSYLWDDRDRRYVDLMTNYGVNLLGHSHPLVTDAITLQASNLTNAHQSFDTPARQDFLEALGVLLPPPLTKISFGNSGADTVAAVMIEPIQGEGGVRVPADGYLKGIRERCNARGILLICDEIQTGFRTGGPFAFTREDIVPDILCLSKSIANGLPMGVTITTEAISDRVPKGSHGSTFAGNPLVCTAAAATLKVLADDSLHTRASSAGTRFQDRVRDLGLPQVREVRGRGLMLAVELKKPSTPVIKAMQERGVLVLPGGGTVIRFLPSILIQDAQLDEGIAALAEALRQIG